MLAYAKAIVAIIGAGITSALTFAVKDSPEFMWLTIASSVVTAIGVYFVPNAQVNGRHEAASVGQ